MAVVKIAKSLRARIPEVEEVTLLRPDDIVKLTGYSRATVYRLIQSKQLPSISNGRTVRVPLLSLRRWIAENTSQSSHASPVV